MKSLILEQADKAVAAITAARLACHNAEQARCALLDVLAELERQLQQTSPFGDKEVRDEQNKHLDRLLEIRRRINSCELGAFVMELTKDSGFLTTAYRALP